MRASFCEVSSTEPKPPSAKHARLLMAGSWWSKHSESAAVARTSTSALQAASRTWGSFDKKRSISSAVNCPPTLRPKRPRDVQAAAWISGESSWRRKVIFSACGLTRSGLGCLSLRKKATVHLRRGLRGHLPTPPRSRICTTHGSLLRARKDSYLQDKP